MEAASTHIRNYMLFLFNLGKNTAEANQLICQAYGKNAINIYTIKKWFKKFGEDDFDLIDKACSGRPQKTKDVALQELLDEDVFLQSAGMSINLPPKEGYGPRARY